MAAGVEVFVEWDTPTVFAGEELRCTITFKNTRPPPSAIRTSNKTATQSLKNARQRWKQDLPIQSPSTGIHIPIESQVANSFQYRHRPTVSLSAPVSATFQSPTSSFSEDSLGGLQERHKRSVSIISIGSQAGTSEGSGPASHSALAHVKRNGHARSASLQGPIPRGASLQVNLPSPLASTLPSGSGGQRSSTSPLPELRNNLTPRDDYRSKPLPDRGPITRNGSIAQKTPPWKHIRSGSEVAGLESRIPLNGTNARAERPSLQRQASQKAARLLNSTTSEGPSHRSLQRVISPMSTEGTPRSSMDIYSHSNNSSETVQSEYLSPNVMTPLEKPRYDEDPNLFDLKSAPRTKTETLMMGYVQLSGSFILDGSLVNLGPFETVKRKGVIGGQGSGGVVGLGGSKKENGLLSSFGWSSIGQSLGTFLGSEEPSSIRDMKGLASTKSIPILSTAQSILFVDLQLRPGERRSFSFKYNLPTGMPPSFKGRAIKSTYALIVGTQRPTGAKQQHAVSQLEVPFKVLSSVNGIGETLGHDLMNPHIILNDLSTTQVLDADNGASIKVGKKPPPLNSASSGFKEYVDMLLADAKEERPGGLLSPTAITPRGSRRQEDSAEKLTMAELIEVAISTQMTKSSSRTSATIFQIHRGGDRVAKVTLNRSGFRLGETVIGSIAFEGAALSCYTVNAFLESSESVDPAIALRSTASIHRMTRRIHAQSSHDTTWAQKVTFGLTIPPIATPDFITTGVSLEWKVRLEFVTGNAHGKTREEELLQDSDADDRATILRGVPELTCQAFDVPIRIRVYGSATDHSDAAASASHMI